MTMSLFEQFKAPSLFHVSLITIAIILPIALHLSSSNRWSESRHLTVQAWTIVQIVRDIFSPMNFGGHKWAALLTSLMIFLITMNTLGLLPYTFTPTTQLSMNLGFAVPLWFSTVALGMRHRPTESLGHLLPEGTPTPLIPILIIIETISLFIRPFALGVRITANLTAGHLLIHLISAGVWALLYMAPPVALISMVVLFLLSILEVAVAVIQAYVFVLLLSLYLQENV
uniref:ATP synthase subunit a n=1 Tax=Lepturacanthus savala TaxID=435161 RepID=A0A6M8NVZ3_9SCOM|nr:ATP synthase F0 subunit 6 [Lepturacanthus savala]QKG02577.1 ATP synthase F0 subunit 6 [Lepturacanthus savala]WCP19607.1 ATP synthase F0 subunit 6 [Lepturacanthus savala]